MMYAATLIQNTVHTLGIDRVGGLTLLDHAGHDTLLAVLRRETEPRHIVVNNCLDGVWGEEVLLRADEDPNGQSEISFKHTARGIELWTSRESRTFEHFGAASADNVGFARLDGCHCYGNTLRCAFEPVYKTVSDIEGYILSRRLEALEARIPSPATKIA